jgi:hypothetical protein
MRHQHTLLTKVLAVALLISPAGPLTGWQWMFAAAPPPKIAATATSAAQPADGGWPRVYSTSSEARVTLYQPQVGPWPDQKHMTLFAAVSYLAPGMNKPALGTLKIETDTKVAMAERLVNFSDFKITQANFPTLSKDQVKAAVDEIKDAIPREERVIGLDRVLAMVDASEIAPKNVQGVKADPPQIFYSQTPAVLINLDGSPIWSPIEGNELKFAVNTNWDLFQTPSNTCYLRVNQSWLVAASITGPWQRADKLPAAFSALPNDANWNEMKAAIPGKPIPADIRPVVFTSTKPAELIAVNGTPQYVPVKGTTLVWLSNTESDVFRLGEGGPIYYLVAGRWFSAPTFQGPWTFATPTLPDDFKKIPLDHPRSRVLASVPGTRQAVEAVLLAQIPQTARVKRSDIKAPEVAYQGEPTFESIPSTTVARAVNTDKDIIKVGDLYYLCFQGVWFKGTSPNGPWKVADSVPKQIYDIPISSPAHNVTYVTVEDSDDEWVEFAAAAAYTGMMVAWGCAMWGTGWYYPPYYWGGAYWGYYPTYGYGARYNPWTGAYTRGGAVYGPYGGAGYAARYNPRTGTYARGAAAWGPGRAVGAAQAWNPRTGTSAQTIQGRNPYGSWGATSVQRGDSWANTARVTNRQTGTTTRATGGSGGGRALTRNEAGLGGRSGIARTGAGDVYAGRDGNVYRNQGGSWQKYENGNWSSISRPGTQPKGTTGRLGEAAGRPTDLSAGTRDQLSRDRSARRDGNQRTRDLGRTPSNGSRGSGSYRPSGGFSRGGGGMRGGMRGGGGRRR